MPVVRGSCLCGNVAWEAAGPLAFMTHCHCSRCRKTHGAAFATYAMCPSEAFRIVRGRDGIERYRSSPEIHRPFCRRCGAVVPDGQAWQGSTGIPAGPLDDDPGVRPLAHIFVASKAPWYEIADGLPRFDAFPVDVGLPALADLPERGPRAGAPRGSCLCGGVAFVVEGRPIRAQHCHCSRCRKGRAAAHASNLFVAIDGLRLTRGEELLGEYQVPGARFFRQVFCRRCGSPMPRRDPARGLAVVPMGAFDDDPGIRPERHIYVGSKAPWYEIADDLPQFAEMPPA
jgi:hypothetical protein